MLKVTIISSWSDLDLVRKVRSDLEYRGYKVIAPTEEWLRFCIATIKIHREKRGKEPEWAAQEKALNMMKYFKFIEESDFVYVINVKDGKEYYGLNTSMEIGVALWLGKPIVTHIPPTMLELRKLTMPWKGGI